LSGLAVERHGDDYSGGREVDVQGTESERGAFIGPDRAELGCRCLADADSEAAPVREGRLRDRLRALFGHQTLQLRLLFRRQQAFDDLACGGALGLLDRALLARAHQSLIWDRTRQRFGVCPHPVTHSA
jgi:hypothetical protein